MKASKAIKRAWKRAGNGSRVAMNDDGIYVRIYFGKPLRKWAADIEEFDPVASAWFGNKRGVPKPARVTPPASLASITTPRANGRARKAS